MVLHANLVIHVPVMLQVQGILVQLPAIHTAHGIDYQVVMQVARVHMGGDQHFIIWELFLGKLHPYGVGQLRREPISLRKGLDEVVKLPASVLWNRFFVVRNSI